MVQRCLSWGLQALCTWYVLVSQIQKKQANFVDVVVFRWTYVSNLVDVLQLLLSLDFRRIYVFRSVRFFVQSLLSTGSFGEWDTLNKEHIS